MLNINLKSLWLQISVGVVLFSALKLESIETASSTSSTWMSPTDIMFGAITVAISVLITGMINNWINRKQVKAETESIRIDNISKLISLKSQENQELEVEIANLRAENDHIKHESGRIREENVRLTFALGDMVKSTIDIETISKVLKDASEKSR